MSGHGQGVGPSGAARAPRCPPACHSLAPAIAKHKGPIFKIATPIYAGAHCLPVLEAFPTSCSAVITPEPLDYLSGLLCHQSKLAARSP